MKKLVLMTWEQVIKLLDFLFEVMKWVLPVVMNLSNNGKEEKKDEDEDEHAEGTEEQ
jgi:hypothetical protein